MCEHFGSLHASRWSILAVGLLLVVGSLELTRSSGRIAAWRQRRLEEARSRPWSKLFYAQLGGFLGPEMYHLTLIGSAIVGLLAGALLLLAGICGTPAT